MQHSDYYLFIDQFTQANSVEERAEAERRLTDLELSGLISTNDTIKLLENDHPVIQIYAAGVLGRQKSSKGIEPLIKLYRDQKNLLVLLQLLDIFLQYESGEFLGAVMSKISSSTWRGLISKKASSERKAYRDQLLTASLKYVQKWGDERIGKKIRPFLQHFDSLVRWNSLKVFDTLGLQLDSRDLEEIAKNDVDRLVRELAEIMIEKKVRAAK